MNAEMRISACIHNQSGASGEETLPHFAIFLRELESHARIFGLLNMEFILGKHGQIVGVRVSRTYIRKVHCRKAKEGKTTVYSTDGFLAGKNESDLLVLDLWSIFLHERLDRCTEK